MKKTFQATDNLTCETLQLQFTNQKPKLLGARRNSQVHSIHDNFIAPLESMKNRYVKEFSHYDTEESIGESLEQAFQLAKKSILEEGIADMGDMDQCKNYLLKLRLAANKGVRLLRQIRKRVCCFLSISVHLSNQLIFGSIHSH